MKNNPQAIDQRSQVRIPDWLFLETQEDDFLIGKAPHEFQDILEEEE